MKSKFFTCLLLATAMSSGFAAATSVSTLKERDAMVKEAISKSSEDALKAINEAQQNGQIKTDDQNYVVVIKIVEPGKKYERVAHSKKEKLEEKSKEVVDTSLVEAMKKAEENLAKASGSIPFSFSAGGKTLWAVLLKKDAYMFFNICESKDKVDELLNSANKPAEIPAEKAVETAPAVTSPVVAPEKPAETTPAAAAATPDKVPDAKSADAAKEPAKADEKKQEVVTTPAATATPDKALDAKSADAAKGQAKTELPSSEKKLEEASPPAVEKTVVADPAKVMPVAAPAA